MGLGLGFGSGFGLGYLGRGEVRAAVEPDGERLELLEVARVSRLQVALPLRARDDLVCVGGYLADECSRSRVVTAGG